MVQISNNNLFLIYSPLQSNPEQLVFEIMTKLIFIRYKIQKKIFPLHYLLFFPTSGGVLLYDQIEDCDKNTHKSTTLTQRRYNSDK